MLKPIRLKLVMKLDRIENDRSPPHGTRGEPILVESSCDMRGSGKGQEGTIRNVTTYSDHRADRQ